MSIVVVDYEMGNVGSIVNMMKRLGHTATVSRAPGVIERAERLILPGVGSFDAGMEKIRGFGLEEILTRKVIAERTPILGICLGMQLLGERSDEGKARGLGWITSESVRFSSEVERVPHMGWNTVQPGTGGPHWLFDGEPDDPRFYFVHSYHVVCKDPADVIATCRYGRSFSAAIARGHILGVQFHPEKSHKFGMKLLGNFASHALCS
ncbi:MAG TPA: imidazole glycerol phosphate synthase subunit HisH [Polyangia bacterium]|nr:imidazole glycerol phosphate synthase subunit HisH [Polyangia bacterium]